MTDEAEARPQAMFLKSVRIRGFRSCADVTIPFSPDVTLLVGENNAGKSNVIEALRLATSPLNGRRTRYFELGDLTRGHSDPVTVTTRFGGLSGYQRAHFIGALELDSSEAVYATRYRPPADSASRSRVEQLVGVVHAPDPEPDKRDQINHVYLTPLRDAQRELDSYSSPRLARIIEYLASPDERDDFVGKASQGMRDLAAHPVVRNVQSAIQTHLTGLTTPGREQVMDAAYDSPDLTRLARSLRLKMAEANLDVADLSESGLGYANLLFMATVVLELQKSKDSELTLFLVEEPEAHLHPQLQSVLLHFLAEEAAASARDDSSAPAGRIQVIATTHSPNLASAVGIENVVILRPSIVAGAASVTTRAIPLARIPLEDAERRKVNQYLDASRSELLFARRAVLVEGISESVLLPVLARHCVYAGDTPEVATARRGFAGVSVVNVGSVDFKPYLKLLLSAIDGDRLVDALVVITDADPALEEECPGDESDDEPAEIADLGSRGGGAEDTGEPRQDHDEQEQGHEQEHEQEHEQDHDGDDEDDAAEDPPKYNRATDLAALIGSLGATHLVRIAEAPHTLEADLLTPGKSNHDLLGTAYIRQKPRSKNQWKIIVEADDPALAFYTRLRQTRRLISKGEFAHDVAQLIAQGTPFTCPDYIDAAIRFVVGDTSRD